MPQELYCYRSSCSINFALEAIGDTWSLLIVRDIVYFGKKTLGEFLSSEEGIARNIPGERLKKLEKGGIILIKNDLVFENASTIKSK